MMENRRRNLLQSFEGLCVGHWSNKPEIVSSELAAKSGSSWFHKILRLNADFFLLMGLFSGANAAVTASLVSSAFNASRSATPFGPLDDEQSAMFLEPTGAEKTASIFAVQMELVRAARR